MLTCAIPEQADSMVLRGEHQDLWGIDGSQKPARCVLAELG